MLDSKLLDEFSRSFAQSLFKEFSEWEQYAQLLPASDAGEGSAIELVVPQPGTDRSLRIDTDDEEITIGFDMWHTHIGVFMGISYAEAIEMAIADIRSIISEQSVITVAHRNGKWAGSSMEDASEVIAAEPGMTIAVYSWRGTLDRIL